MTDILRLPGWVPTSVDETDDRMIIHAEYTKQPEACQVCGVVGAALYKHGRREITFLERPFGVPTKIVAKVQRYRCRECGGLFPQPLEGIDAERRMTQRCVTYISRRALVDTFQSVSQEVGCDEKTVRNVANSHIEVLDEDYKPYLPEWIGLDENHLNKIMRAVITDVFNRKPIDMLIDRHPPTLRKWFGQFKDRSHVKGLTIDMYRPYRRVAAELFGDLPVVVDKFHVVKKANESVDRVRKRLGKKRGAKTNTDWKRRVALLRMRYRDLNDKQRFNLDMWLDNEPELAQAYWLKERLFDIYDLPKAEAIEAFDSYAGTVPANLKADFLELTRAMKNWRSEILNYFDFPITNAYTEGINGITKVINRMGRGYSFEGIRARLLFGDRKVSARQLRAKRAAELAQMYRCFCCHGLYSGDEMDADAKVLAAVRQHAPGAADGESSLLMCRECEARFNQEETTHHLSLSTD
jgi:transposase